MLPHFSLSSNFLIYKMMLIILSPLPHRCPRYINKRSYVEGLLSIKIMKYQ